MSNKHIVCSVRNSVNRVPAEKLGDVALCGKCKNRLFAGTPVELNPASFQKHVERDEIPVVV
ncbi:MAG: thiol reductase thioredoxin, partial [Desulfobacterales bacterium]